MVYSYKERKIVGVLAEGLETWRAMNALGHMALALGANKDGELMGRGVLADKSGGKHLGIARYGFIIKKADRDSIKTAIASAKTNADIIVADFTREMLDTAHDNELAASIALKNSNDFEYLGALFYGPPSEIDNLTKKFKLWK